QVVIVPIYKGEESKATIDAKAGEIMASLKALGIRVKYDNSDNSRPGWKFAQYELQGVPIRLAMGLRDMENQVVELARRDTKEKTSMPMEGLAAAVANLLNEIQNNMFNKALAFRNENIREVDSWDDFVKTLDEKTGFVSAHWDGTAETEEKIKNETKATIRCIPLDNKQEEGKCVLTGNPSTQRVLFARAY
ncbi:MAG: His/Gly/Thr/Pro-type tRNA ligase C-terminal domain-containing protein, partial [Ferruginibacter sp.]